MMIDMDEGKREEGKEEKKRNPWFFSTVAMVIILGAVLIYSLGTPTAMVTVSSQEATDKAIDFINNYMLSGTTASVVDTEDIGDLYKINLDIAGSEVEVYVTKDGKLLFPSVVDMTETPETTTTVPQEIPKTEKPEAHAFIMSYCPYGLQFLKAYVPVIELLGDKADLELNFVHYIMHGKDEIDENTRMYCIQKEQKDKLTEYLSCFVENDDYEKCIAEAGIDKAKLESCISVTDEQYQITYLYNDQSTWSGGSYPQYPVDEELATQYGVSGSPTFVINDQIVSVSRSAEAIKEAVCSAFTTPPAECEQTLSTNTESPGIGPIGAGSGASSGGQC